MKRSYFLPLLISMVLTSILANPVSTVWASDTSPSVSAQEAVVASAVVVPSQVTQLGFLISATAKEIPVQEGDTVKAGQTLILLDTPDLQYAVVAAEAAVRSAQSYADLQKYRRVENRRNGKVFYDVVPAVYRQRADLRVQQAQTALQLAQVDLAEARLIAPIDGTVASINVIPGEFVPSDQAVITLATLDMLQLETTDLSERDIAKVDMGAPVNIFIEALNANFTGKVAGIAPKADIVSGDAVFKVTIAFDEQPAGLLWGMTAEVTINE